MNDEVRGNQFPFKSHHFNALHQVREGVFVGMVDLMHQTYQNDGGCNPNAVNLVFPEGKDGPIDELELEDVLKNFGAWHEAD